MDKKCLCCGRKFKAESSTNRICSTCKKKNGRVGSCSRNHCGRQVNCKPAFGDEENRNVA